MRTKDFHFELPEHLIAQEPPKQRGESRLMVLTRGDSSMTHAMVGELPRFLEEGSLLVFNDSRVRKARLYAIRQKTGRRHECLLLRPRPDGLWEFQGRGMGDYGEGEGLEFPEGLTARVSRMDGQVLLGFSPGLDEAYFERNGHVPLPPYIKRPDRPEDTERYQSIFARSLGSAAAPTASLHFSQGMLSNLAAAGMEIAYITLHVGLGTFLPVRSEDIEGHRLHQESYCIPPETVEAFSRAKALGRKVVAVGTTSLRCMEAASDNEGANLRIGPGSTDIFITPGYIFKAVDCLFTNFHTPESSLLMLVSAFYGREPILTAYRAAIEREYRFFSYGDAMLIR